MTILLVAVSLTAMRCFRRRHYNAFYYIHNFCFIPFLVLLIFHPVGYDLLYILTIQKTHTDFIDRGNLKELVNWREHYPDKVFVDENSSPPVFAPIKTHTWLWISVPLLVYVIDWCYRKYVRRNPAVVLHSIMHEDQVLELGFTRSLNCFPKPGQVSIS